MFPIVFFEVQNGFLLLNLTVLWISLNLIHSFMQCILAAYRSTEHVTVAYSVRACLCHPVDELSVDKALEVLSARPDRVFDAPLGVTELTEYLVVLCAHLQTQRINVALAADLILNWLLNVYDQSVIRPVALCCDLLFTTRVSLQTRLALSALATANIVPAIVSELSMG